MNIDWTTPTTNMPTMGAQSSGVLRGGVHPMCTCNSIAIQRWLRFSVGHEVEQMAEEDGWQESRHITCC